MQGMMSDDHFGILAFTWQTGSQGCRLIVKKLKAHSRICKTGLEDFRDTQHHKKCNDL